MADAETLKRKIKVCMFDQRGGSLFADSLAALLRLVLFRYAASRLVPSSPAWASRGVCPPRAECGLSAL